MTSFVKVETHDA